MFLFKLTPGSSFSLSAKSCTLLFLAKQTHPFPSPIMSGKNSFNFHQRHSRFIAMLVLVRELPFSVNTTAINGNDLFEYVNTKHIMNHVAQTHTHEERDSTSTSLSTQTHLHVKIKLETGKSLRNPKSIKIIIQFESAFSFVRLP